MTADYIMVTVGCIFYRLVNWPIWAIKRRRERPGRTCIQILIPEDFSLSSSDMVDAVPIFGLVKGLIHLASGDVIAGQRCLIFSSIVSVVLIVGYVALQYGGVFIAICSGVGAFVIIRGLTTAVMPNGIPSQPQRNLHAIRAENRKIAIEQLISRKWTR